MSKFNISYENFKKFIIPAFPSLINLTSFNGYSNIEKSILENTVQCITNFIKHLSFNYPNQVDSLITTIISYQLQENLNSVNIL